MPLPSNPAATLAVMADHLDRYHQEMADLLPPYVQADQADMIHALVESERALRVAARALRKAAKVADHAA